MASAETFEETKTTLWRFMLDYIYPNEQLFIRQSREIRERSNEWTHPPVLVELIRKAKGLGLWNLFLPVDSARHAGLNPGSGAHATGGRGFNNRQYAEICEILGTSNPIEFASQATNCASPDTGNMEV